MKKDRLDPQYYKINQADFSYLAPDLAPGLEAGQLLGRLLDGLGGPQQLILSNEHGVVGIHPVSSLVQVTRCETRNEATRM